MDGRASEDEFPLGLGGTPTSSPTSSPARRVRGERRWEEQHQRVTFYCPRTLLRAIEIEGARSRRSKTQVIVDAVVEHLAAH
jgi:hypothetical protein